MKPFFVFLRILFFIFLFLLFIVPSSWAKVFSFGVNADNWKGEIYLPGFSESLKAMGVEFIVWHLSPEEESSSRMMELVHFSRKHGFAYLFNTELVNYVPGVPYFENKDGTYRWDLREETLLALEDDPLFLGQVYDEPMLMQSANGQKINSYQVKPYFLDTSEMLPKQAFDAVTKKIAHRSQQLSSYGKYNVFEMVFPDYAAAPARGKAILAPKFLKETPMDLMFAVYAGAARQYEASELWACIDLWFRNKFPEHGEYQEGFHSPDDLYQALCYVYAMGFDRVYVEHVKALIDLRTGKLTEYGRSVQRFQQDRADLCRTDWREFVPEIVVKRFPDGYWGQNYSPFLVNHPYGCFRTTSELLQASNSWLKFLSTQSRGRLPEDANNWNALLHPFFKNTAFFLKADLPSMLIVDHTFENFDLFPEAQLVDFTVEKGNRSDLNVLLERYKSKLGENASRTKKTIFYKEERFF